MIYGSVCSGIEAASVAWEPLGWTPAFFSEIEAFPRAVLAERFPSVPLHGDFRTIGAGDYGAIDLLVGGTPCQDFSVAGLRAGLDGDRGALTIEFVKLIDRIRPRWVVWENVTGILSADGGRAFGTFLGELGKLGYGFAYRVLDAQFFGVPQQRRRVFLVGYFGDWRRAAAVLFERASLSGDSAPRRKAGARPALIAGDGAGSGVTQSLTIGLASGGPDLAHAQAGWLVAHSSVSGKSLDVAGTIDTRSLDGPRRNQDAPIIVRTLMSSGAGMDRPAGIESETDFLVAFSCKDNGRDVSEIAPTMRAMGGQVAIAFDLAQITSNVNRNRAEPGLPQPPLAAGGQPHVAFTEGSLYASASETNSSPLLRSLWQAVGAEAFAEWRLRVSDTFQPPALLQPQMHGGGVRCEADQVESRMDDGALSRAENLPEGSLREVWLSAFGGPPPRRELAEQLARELRATLPIVPHERTSAVRRLTPTEAERLQGFPDGWTAVTYRKKPAADGPRYRALGNSMAVPCMAWLGNRIAMVDAINGDA
jgi:DNA (cytosine-5)-methyltransferase 1